MPEDGNTPEHWTTEIAELPQLRHAFNENAGALIPHDAGGVTPLHCFRLMFSCDIEKKILKRTGNLLGANRAFVPSYDDLHRFILIGLMMCINIRRDWRDHWKRDTLLADPNVTSLGSRDRFMWMLANLHPKPKQLWKLANRNFHAQWSPFEHVAVDESLIPFKGRYRHRVHIRGKPHATGIKLYCLADEEGFIFTIHQYRGIHQSVPEIVLNLLRTLPSSRYKVYCDAWYGSGTLAHVLLENDFHFNIACGNNKPAAVFSEFLDRGLVKNQVRYLQSIENPSLLAVSFYDKAKCHFMTDLFRPGMTSTRSGKQIPTIVEDYRLHMGNVDRANNLVQVCTWPHKNRRWTMACFWHLVAVCVSNARFLYTHLTDSYCTLPEFLHELITEWRYLIQKMQVTPQRPRHKLEKSDSRRRCEVCKYIDRNIGKTYLKCVDCDVYLHDTCSIEYHRSI